MKKILALLLALVMVLSLGACAPKEEGELAGDLNNDGQIEMGQDGVEVEVNVSDVHLDCVEAFESGNWEALFTPVDIPERIKKLCKSSCFRVFNGVKQIFHALFAHSLE